MKCYSGMHYASFQLAKYVVYFILASTILALIAQDQHFNWSPNLGITVFLFLFNYLIHPIEASYEVLYDFFSGLFSLWNSKFCQKFFNFEGKRNSPYLFFLFKKSEFVVKLLQAAYNVGGHCVNAYVIQSSILGILPHYSAPVC